MTGYICGRCNGVFAPNELHDCTVTRIEFAALQADVRWLARYALEHDHYRGPWPTGMPFPDRTARTEVRRIAGEDTQTMEQK